MPKVAFGHAKIAWSNNLNTGSILYPCAKEVVLENPKNL
jgi:hypothetical protein